MENTSDRHLIQLPSTQSIQVDLSQSIQLHSCIFKIESSHGLETIPIPSDLSRTDISPSSKLSHSKLNLETYLNMLSKSDDASETNQNKDGNKSVSSWLTNCLSRWLSPMAVSNGCPDDHASRSIQSKPSDSTWRNFTSMTKHSMPYRTNRMDSHPLLPPRRPNGDLTET